MRHGVPLFSPEGYQRVARGPGWREPREEPPEDDPEQQYLAYLDEVQPPCTATNQKP